jgi:3-hydroxy acid dehydrogenase/malonic semialdehyde reductase
MALSIKDNVVLITGASSGIGKAAAYAFAEQGARLILSARREERLVQLAKDLQHQYKSDVLVLCLDVADKSRVATVLSELPESWAAVDILVNNAGLALDSVPMQQGVLEHWDTMIDTNVRGLLYVTHALVPGMIARERGHIINVGSIAGRDCYQTGNIYCATKHAVRSITQSLRVDLLGTPLRVTEIAPGAVETEFSEVRWQDKARAHAFYQDFIPLSGEDVADTMVYCATRPLHVDVAELVIYPTAQASANHLHRAGEKIRSLFD